MEAIGTQRQERRVNADWVERSGEKEHDANRRLVSNRRGERTEEEWGGDEKSGEENIRWEEDNTTREGGERRGTARGKRIGRRQ